MTHKVEEAASAASSLSPIAPTPQNGPAVVRCSRLSPRFTITLCLAAITVAGVRLGMLSPWYQEWRLSRLPLPELLREVRTQWNKPTLLYYAGLRLTEQN